MYDDIFELMFVYFGVVKVVKNHRLAVQFKRFLLLNEHTERNSHKTIMRQLGSMLSKIEHIFSFSKMIKLSKSFYYNLFC